MQPGFPVQPGFANAAQHLRAVLVQQLKEPLVLCGRILSARDVATLYP